MLDWLRLLYGTREIEPQNPDVIFVFGYGSVRWLLMKATEEGMRLAAQFANKFPNAKVVAGHSYHCFEGSQVYEFIIKKQLLVNSGISGDRFITAGSIQNTIGEFGGALLAFKELGIDPKEILLLCDVTHSRSIMWLAKRYFPKAKLSLRYIPAEPYQADAVFPAQRSGWAWLRVNVKRDIALRILGLDWVRKQVHRK